MQAGAAPATADTGDARGCGGGCGGGAPAGPRQSRQRRDEGRAGQARTTVAIAPLTDGGG